MSLLVTNNRDAAGYLQSPNFIPTSQTRQVLLDGALSGLMVYVDKFDRCHGWVSSQESGAQTPVRWDPNLIDGTSSSVFRFNSPLNNQTNTPWFVSDYDPSTTNQRLFQALSQAKFQEVSMADPSVLLDTDPFPKITRGGGVDYSLGSSEEFAWGVFGGGNPNMVFFPEIDLMVAVQVQVVVGATPGTAKTNVITFVTISTGAGVPSGIPGVYQATPDEFGRPLLFDETGTVRMVGVQFIADDESTPDQPKGELLFWSNVTAPLTANDGRCYIKFVDFNPSAVPGVPNRVHLRETLLSRVNLTLNTLPTGSPPSPLDGLPVAFSSLQAPNCWFGGEGNRRINIMANDTVSPTFGHTIIVQASKAVVASIITPPAPKLDPITNREVSYQAEVLGDLGELVGNAIVDFSVARLSTVSETLATTPTPGETVTVDNVPIDRSIEFAAGFAVFEDGVALTETTHYSVNEALGQITFVGPKPLAGGEVYSARYAHIAAPATPGHGTIIDAQVYSSIAGVAETRLSYPDDDALAGHIDLLSATVAT